MHNESELFLEALICVEQCFIEALILSMQYVLLNIQAMPRNQDFNTFPQIDYCMLGTVVFLRHIQNTLLL